MAKGVAPAGGEDGGHRYTKQFSKKLRRRAEEAAAAVSEDESGEDEDEDEGGEDEEEDDGEELAESSDEGEEEDEVAVPAGRAAKAQRAAKGKQPRHRGSEFVDDAAAEDEARAVHVTCGVLKQALTPTRRRSVPRPSASATSSWTTRWTLPTRATRCGAERTLVLAVPSRLASRAPSRRPGRRRR